MGQYHVTVNLTKREFINPHGLGCGLKLWEQIDTRAGVPTALVALLACSNGRGAGDLDEYPESPDVVGRWAGDRVAVVGDYAEDADLRPEDHAALIYSLCSSYEDRVAQPDAKAEVLKGMEPYRDITPLVAVYLERLCGVRYEGEGWKKVVDAAGRQVPRTLAPDMVVTSEGIQAQPRFVVGGNLLHGCTPSEKHPGRCAECGEPLVYPVKIDSEEV